MMSKGKGVPVPVEGNWQTVVGQRKSQKFRISTYATEVADVPKGSADVNAIPIETMNFISGNPDVEVTKGILHLYKDNDRLFLEPGSTSPRSELLCVMAIPASVSCSELLTFISEFMSSIEHVKIICDTSPNHYMALLKFKEQIATDAFYLEFNGKKYNSFDDTICLLAYVSRIETVKESDGAGQPLSGHTELPTCPVCLDRMDESIDGLLTILCNHSFHTSCLIKWSDNGCPVCRYVQTPENVANNFCVECNSKDQLWVCLICGHIGCGRYLHGHAYKHYCETEHAYAIQPDNNRVWDYIGDNFVHRLFQNKGDGKVVDVPGRRFEGDISGTELEEAEEKVDSIQLEFTHMLTSQLEEQRIYFEDQLRQAELTKQVNMDDIVAKLHKVEIEQTNNEAKLRETLRDRKELEKKLAKTTSKLERIQEESTEQRAVMTAMAEDLNYCKTELRKFQGHYDEYRIQKEKEIEELQDTIRDLSIFIQTEKAISESPFADEVRQGSVQLPTPTPSKPSSSKANKKHGGK